MKKDCPCRKGDISGRYYTRQNVRYFQFHNGNHEPCGTSEYEYVSGRKRKYCAVCHIDITKMIDKMLADAGVNNE